MNIAKMKKGKHFGKTCYRESSENNAKKLKMNILENRI